MGHCRSPEYIERVKNLTSEWNQKQQSFIPHASRSLLCIRFVAVAFWAKKQFFKLGTPVTYFCPALDPPLGRYGRNILMHIQGHNVGSQEKGAKCTFGQKSLFAIFGSVKGVCTLCQKILHGFAIVLKLLINSQKSLVTIVPCKKSKRC